MGNRTVKGHEEKYIHIPKSIFKRVFGVIPIAFGIYFGYFLIFIVSEWAPECITLPDTIIWYLGNITGIIISVVTFLLGLYLLGIKDWDK